ncbi:MAG: nitroreductase family protein [Thermodesulfobacteriota bacterium]
MEQIKLMDIFEAILKRRSIRKYMDKDIPDEILEKILEAGTWAPSSCNEQLWNFIVVKSKETRERLVSEAGSSSLILKAPLLVVNTYHNQNLKEAYTSMAVAIQNTFLTAFALGLGSLWLDSIGKERVVKDILAIPDDQVIVCFSLFGYPKKTILNPPPRKPLDKVVHRESFFQKQQNTFYHDPNKWTIESIREYQRFFCRKTELGHPVDVVNRHEKAFIEKLLSGVSDAILDVFSYDGSLLNLFPMEAQLFSLNLSEQTSIYTKNATEHEVEHLIYDGSIELENESIGTATCLFKLERIPTGDYGKLFKEIKRVLRDDGRFLILTRESRSLYNLFYMVMSKIFGDNVKKSAIFSFFGPYKPLNSKTIKTELENSGFKVVVERFCLFPPIFEDIFHLFLQYRASGGTTFLHAMGRKSFFLTILRKIFDLQKVRRSRSGSLALITAGKNTTQ